MMNRKMSKVRKFAATAILAAGVMAISIPVMAGTLVKTEDNMIRMELPENGWYEMDAAENVKDEMIFTNGKDSISIRKFTADELKDMDVQEAEELMKFRWADEDFESVFQISYSEKEDLYVVTAAAEEKADLPEIYKALQTIEFDVLPEEAAKDYTVEAADKTMYATAKDGLNIRKGFDTSSEVIDIYGYAEQVHVTGYVKCNGENTGWCRVEKDNVTGYVSGKSLSENKPEEEKKEEYTVVGDIGDVFSENGDVIHLCEYSDGTIRDINGIKFEKIAMSTWQDENGNVYSVENPLPEKMILVNGVDETEVEVSKVDNKTYKDSEDNEYKLSEDGLWYANDGSYFNVKR